MSSKKRLAKINFNNFEIKTSNNILSIHYFLRSTRVISDARLQLKIVDNIKNKRICYLKYQTRL